MKYQKLATVLREEAEKLRDDSEGKLDADRTAELLRCFARILEGKTVYRAMGAPGDWGYGTSIGDALREGYSNNDSDLSLSPVVKS